MLLFEYAASETETSSNQGGCKKIGTGRNYEFELLIFLEKTLNGFVCIISLVKY